jgi:hypothetical protein
VREDLDATVERIRLMHGLQRVLPAVEAHGAQQAAARCQHKAQRVAAEVGAPAARQAATVVSSGGGRRVPHSLPGSALGDALHAVCMRCQTNTGGMACRGPALLAGGCNLLHEGWLTWRSFYGCCCA